MFRQKYILPKDISITNEEIQQQIMDMEMENGEVEKMY